MSKSSYQGPKGFETVQNVVDIQNSVLGMISGGTSTSEIHEKTLLDRIKEREKQELISLKQYFLNKETALYSALGVRDYKDLYDKTVLWKNSGAINLLQNSALVQEIIQIFSTVSTGDLEKVITQFNNEKISQEDLIGIFGEEISDLAPAIGQLVGGSLKGGSDNRKGTVTLTFEAISGASSSWDQKGEFLELKEKKGITFFKSKKQNKIEIRFTQNIPAKSQSQLTEKFYNMLDKSKGVELTTVSQLNTLIKQKILSYLPAANYPLANNSINEMITKFLINSQEIAISKNTNTIRGALGEIYWNAFFDFLRLHSIPAGLTALTTTSKEPPIDIVFESFGFQVKHYTVNNGIVTFNSHFDRKIQEMVPNKTPLGTFFARTLELGEGAREQFGKFYFSSIYNSPNSDSKYNEEKYRPIFSRFSSIRSGINTYIESNLDKILNINKNVQLKDAQIFDEKLDAGKPVMFFINENPFPASEFIQDLIDGLDAEFNGAINIEIKDLKIDLSSFQNIGATWPDKAEANISERIKNASASYIVEVQVNNLLEKILSRIKH